MAQPNQHYLREPYVTREFTSGQNIVPVIIVDPNTGQPVNLSSSSPSTSNMVTPEQFGAVGDGTTDDTAAFANLSNALLTQENNFVMFGKNQVYLINDEGEDEDKFTG